MFMTSPMEFSIFPSVLLVTTMLRLGLNVATTRLILLHGNEGVDAAGTVIKAFGEFVVGGNYLIGVVIFLILVITSYSIHYTKLYDRAVDAYVASLADWKAAGIERECTSGWEAWTSLSRSVASEYGVPMASMYDVV